ncbi:spermatogenesis-associated protein 5-like protein 1 [Corvus kubaryi]|uniref:spermatogenesis-associated protein 5-like protein 1 n=1 Tax=Corvus kubaryi TaxID=68294 RepID=UPI001C04DF3D|nr:spermatogenesis-associated protein 5-like protein 1 [Corvus kubaryi]
MREVTDFTNTLKRTKRQEKKLHNKEVSFTSSRQHFSDDSLRERHGVSPGERRVGGARPRQPAGAGSALRPPARPSRPAASRRLGGVTSRGVSGTYVTLRGRRRCFSPFPKTNSFPRPRNSLSALGQPSARRRRFLPQVLPAPPPPSLPAGRGAAPAPRRDSGAQHRLPPGSSFPPPQAAPGSQHGRGKAAGAPAEKDSTRKVSLPLPSRPEPGPNPGRQERSQTALLTRLTRCDLQLFSLMRSMLLLLYMPANKTRFIGTLLALIDNLACREVVVIRAISRLGSLDPALQRPGCFARELRFNLSDEERFGLRCKVHCTGARLGNLLVHWQQLKK